MNPVAEEILSYLGTAESTSEEDLMHYGMPRRSGRYPYGSGEDPYQHERDFLGRVDEMRKNNFTYTDEDGKVWTGDAAIAKDMGLSTTQFRTELGLAKDEIRMYQVGTAKRLRDKEGMGPSAIGKKMGLPESTVRSLLNENSEARMLKAKETAEFLKARSKEFAKDGGMIDVGAGTELELNMSREKMNQALYLLEKEGYNVYGGRFEQVNNPGKFTTQLVLCPPGTEHKEIYDLDRVHTIKDYITRDGGETYEKKFNYPESMDSKRMMIRYNEDGGVERDGLVELRRGVPDLSLGESRFAQVRILVDGTHYIKGMAAYSDDMPDGVDVIFNTNKKRGTAMKDVLKEIKEDPDNPFGSTIKDADQGGQYWYDPKTGVRVSASTRGAKLGLINKRSDEGDWNDWQDALPSQFLAKQSLKMIKKQLDLAKADKQAEFDEICALDNPTVKKHYLEKFAEGCDATAVSLKAAALPGQRYHVIIPINTLKDNEVYAPGYEPGTQLALVRYPHGGTFEIPILTVTDKNKLARSVIGTESIDGIGINHKVAARLSGADFDGDTVMCIPTNDKAGKVKVTSTPSLKGLEGFEPKDQYGADDVRTDAHGNKHYYQNGVEYRTMKKGRQTETQMGIISNLITDMTLAGADEDELARAVRHSMVVIDAAKHHLNYKQSEVDNNIAALHKEYQGKESGGAATILSRAKGEQSVIKRQGTPKVNKKGTEWYDPSKPEGALIYKEADAKDLYLPVRSVNKKTGMITLTTTTGEKIKYKADDEDARAQYRPIKRVDKDTDTVTYTNPSGTITYKMEKRTQKSSKMAETDDAYTLVSDTHNKKETAYADYANSLKALANRARKEMVYTGNLKYDPNAKRVYQKEYDQLMADLNKAELNKTRERAAQRMSRAEVDAKTEAGTIADGDRKKVGQQAVSRYRTELGSVARRDRNIVITDREWEAIQAGAITESKLKRILNNTDADKLRERAMPKSTSTLSAAKVNKIKRMSDSNFTLAQIAEACGCSVSTVSKYLKGVN